MVSDLILKDVICQAKEFRLYPEMNMRAVLELGASPTAQMSDDEVCTKAKVMVIERGHTQEMLNRSLPWAIGCLVVQWLLREEERGFGWRK